MNEWVKVQDIFGVTSNVVCFRVPYERLHEVIDVLNTYGYCWRGGGQPVSVPKPVMEDCYRISEHDGMNPHIVLRLREKRVSWDNEKNIKEYTHIDDGMEVLLGESTQVCEPLDLTSIL